MLDKARTLENAEKALHAATEGMRKGLETFAETEKQNIKLFQGKIFDEQGPVVKPHESTQSSLEALFTLYASKKNTEEECNAYTNLTLVALFEYEIASIEAIRELLKWHDDTIKDIEVHKNKVKMYDKIEKFEKQINEWKNLITEKEKLIQYYYKGLIFFTLPFISRQRAYNYRKFFSSRITTLQSTSYCIFKASEAYFNQVILNTELVNEDTSRTLEILKVKPALRIPHDELEALTGRKNRSSLTLKTGNAGNMYLAQDTTGLMNLFDRALALTQKKPFENAENKRFSSREEDEHRSPPPPPPPPLPPMPPSFDTHPKDQEVWGEEAQFT